MSKILILAESGFGKTSSIGPITKEDFLRAGIKDREIKGLDPKKTFIISATNKGLPIPRWRQIYKLGNPAEGNYMVSNSGDTIAKAIIHINQFRSDINIIALDDSNYIMQDHYMSKALTTGFDVFKKIGAMMGGIFNAMESVSGTDKHFIMMAHMEEYKNSNVDTISYRYKTVGKMVQDYITPEGKFEIVLFGKQFIENVGGVNVLRKVFVTNYDGQYPAKSPVGMFPDLYIPNDLGLVIDAVNKYGL